MQLISRVFFFFFKYNALCPKMIIHFKRIQLGCLPSIKFHLSHVLNFYSFERKKNVLTVWKSVLLCLMWCIQRQKSRMFEGKIFPCFSCNLYSLDPCLIVQGPLEISPFPLRNSSISSHRSQFFVFVFRFLSRHFSCVLQVHWIWFFVSINFSVH